VPRPLRIEVEGGYYHVVTRGNDRQVIFDDRLRKLFLLRATVIAKRYGWHVYAYALMANHFHLVLRIAGAGLSRGMCELNGGFARASNAQFGRIDHCFGRRFWSTHLETDSHLLESVRYATWNPARAGVGQHPGDSRWTSFRAIAGLDHPSELLAHRELLEHFGRDAVQARAAFSRFVSEGRVRCQAPWQEVYATVTSASTRARSRPRAA
jgi:REP-associated tyrosine transposase